SDGKRVVTAGADKVVRIWDVGNLKTPERQLTGQPTPVRAVALSADGQTLASAGEGGAVRLWNRQSGALAGVLGAHEGAVPGLAVTPGLVLTASVDGSVKMWSPPSAATAPRTYSHAGAVTAAVLSPDGSRLLTGCADKSVRLWRLDNH